MSFNKVWRGALAPLLCLCALATSSWALDGSVPAIHGDVSRSLLGDGTGVVIAIVDSGVDDLHPALAGNDSLGNPRLVAEANFVTYEASTGDDVFGHGTWVASAALSRDPVFTGMATDARFINARVLDNGNGFPNDVQVRNGLGYAIDHGADVVNLSLNFFAPNSSGSGQLDLMVDWAAEQGISCAICTGNIAGGNGSQLVRSPGSAYNGVTVGRTTADFSRVHTDSGMAYTADGRMKPDVVAPGSDLTLANDDWEGAAADWDQHLNGCSFATPHVAGLMAQEIDAGKRLGWSTDPLIIKSTIMNSAEKVLDKSGNAWQPANSLNVSGVYQTSRPLDDQSGAGQVDGATLAVQYLAGEQAPGLVDSVGWDFNSIGNSQFIDYVIDPNLNFGTKLAATLTWYRHVARSDDGNNLVDSGDFFSASLMSNLNLQLFKDGNLMAQSISAVDNVEHLLLDIDESSQYMLRVRNMSAFGTESFGLAWFGTAVPEPGCLLMLCTGIAGVLGSARRRRVG